MRKALLFISLCAGCIIGIAVIDTTANINIVIGIISLSMLITIFLPRFQVVVFLLCLGIVLGSWRFVYLENQTLDLSEIKNITFTGIVVDEVEQRISKQRVLFETEDVVAGEKIKILVALPLYPKLEFGQQWNLTGKLQLPESFTYIDSYGRGVEFAYDQYLKLKKIDYVMYYPSQKSFISNTDNKLIRKTLFNLKTKVTYQLNKILPEPHAAFISAILWGSRNALDPQVKSDFQRAGLSHIVALSGFNISIISLALMRLAPYIFISRRMAVLLTILVITSFVIFTGAQSSIVRAALMGSGSVIAYQLGRRASALILLFVSGTTMTMLHPLILLHDIGFQLSFLATLGLLLFSRSFEKWLNMIPNWFELRMTISATLSATIATLPILIMYFGRISTVALFANMAIVPVIPALMLVSFAGLLLSYISSYLSAGFIFLTWLISSYIIKISKFLAHLDFAEFQMPFLDIYIVLLIYFIFFLILVFMHRKEIFKLKRYLE